MRIRKFLKRALLTLAGLLLLLIMTGWGIGCLLSGPHYRGPVSDHFDGRRFVNQVAISHRSLGEFLRWMWTRQPGHWTFIDAPPGSPPPTRVGPGQMRVTFVNHATMLLQMDGLNILTDPIWSERASPFAWIGPRRMRPPGIRFRDLPPIDIVVISHNHYDHLDLPTLQRLARAHHPRFIVGLGNRALLTAAGIDRVTEIDWWQAVMAGPLTITSVPAQHFSARGLCDRDATLWTGYVFSGPAGKAYFAGDTGFGPHFRQIRERFGPLRLAMLPIGAYRPEWFMGRVHLSPRDAVRAHDLLDARTSLAIHYGTFRLADDGQNEPLEALARALQAHNSPRPQIWALGFGEGRNVP